MNKTALTGIALLLSLSALPAAAQEMRPYFSGGIDYVFEDDDRTSDSGPGLYLSVGDAISERLGLELSGFYHTFGDDGVNKPSEWREYGLKLDGLFFYSRNPAFSPYFGVGVGIANSDLRNTATKTSTDPFADAGLGFMTYFGSPDIGLRADLRYRWLDVDGSAGTGRGTFNEPVVRIGLVFPFGTATPATPWIAGSQISAGKVTAGDSDGDGVLDASDKCPGTPAGWLIDANGCPIDSDRDGVPDNLDKCPGTAVGISVDATGCPLSGAAAGPNRSFENINFAYDKADLTDYAKALLDNTATVIGGLVTKYPSLKVDVSGHTDWVGTDAYNQALSERRAVAVKEYLTRKGVEAGRISSFAYGESKPIAPNETEEGRAQNRRGEVRTRE